MRRSSRRRSASSRSHGLFEVASTITSASALPTTTPPPQLLPVPPPPPMPSIWTSSSDLRRRLASCSPAAPRAETSASISSKKTIEGAWWRASANSVRASRSDSPWYFETSDEAEMLKKAVLPSEATARASSVLPVPGGPKSRTPFHGARHDAFAK